MAADATCRRDASAADRRRFDEPLDHAMLQHAIRVSSEVKKLSTGRVTIDQQETRWRFEPTSPWSAGPLPVADRFQFRRPGRQQHRPSVRGLHAIRTAKCDRSPRHCIRNQQATRREKYIDEAALGAFRLSSVSGRTAEPPRVSLSWDLNRTCQTRYFDLSGKSALSVPSAVTGNLRLPPGRLAVSVPVEVGPSPANHRCRLRTRHRVRSGPRPWWSMTLGTLRAVRLPGSFRPRGAYSVPSRRSAGIRFVLVCARGPVDRTHLDAAHAACRRA